MKRRFAFLALLLAFFGTTHAPVLAQQDPPPDLREAKDSLEELETTAYAALLELLDKQESAARRESTSSASNPASAQALQRRLLELRDDRARLLQNGALPTHIEPQPDVVGRVIAARQNVANAYEAAIRAAIADDKKDLEDLLTRGRTARAALHCVSPWIPDDELVRGVKCGTGSSEWSREGARFLGPEAPGENGRFAPFVLALGESRPFSFQATLARLVGSGGLILTCEGSNGEAYPIPISAAALAVRAGAASAGQQVRVRFTGAHLSVELEGREVLVHGCTGEDGPPLFTGIRTLSIASDDRRTRWSVSACRLRYLGSASPVQRDLLSTADRGSAPASCGGALIPSLASLKASAPVVDALRSYDAQVEQLCGELKNRVEEVVQNDKKAPDISTKALRESRERANADLERLEWRGDPPRTVALDVRTGIEARYVNLRSAVLSAYDAAVASASDAAAAALLGDERDWFASTQHCAPWWGEERTRSLAQTGADSSSWSAVGTSWLGPVRTLPDGSRTPFRLQGDLPWEFLLELRVSVPAEAREGFRLHLARATSTWDVELSHEQIDPLLASTADPRQATLSLQIALTRTRLLMRVNQQRVWCQAREGADASPGGETLGSPLELSLAAKSGTARFKVDGLRVKAIRSNAEAKSEPRAEPAPESQGALAVAPGDPAGQAILDGLRWLARHQASDGSWGTLGLKSICDAGKPCFASKDPSEAQYEVGLTALGLLCFLNSGYTDQSKSDLVDPVRSRRQNIGELVRRGLEWLAGRQNDQGYFSKGQAYMYNEALAARALVEAYRLTRSEQWKAPAQRAVDFIQAAQRPSPMGTGLWGWRYVSRQSIEEQYANRPMDEAGKKALGDADISVSVWCAELLLAAENAGLFVDPESRLGAQQFVTWITADNGLVGYVDPKGAGAVVTGPGDDKFDYHIASMCALGICTRTGLGLNGDDPALDLGAARLIADLPVVDKNRRKLDYYYWYHGTVALSRLDGPNSLRKSGKYWSPWRNAVLDALLSTQDRRQSACSAGGWLLPDRWAYTGGPIYTTAMSILALQETRSTRGVRPASAPRNPLVRGALSKFSVGATCAGEADEVQGSSTVTWGFELRWSSIDAATGRLSGELHWVENTSGTNRVLGRCFVADGVPVLELRETRRIEPGDSDIGVSYRFVLDASGSTPGEIHGEWTLGERKGHVTVRLDK